MEKLRKRAFIALMAVVAILAMPPTAIAQSSKIIGEVEDHHDRVGPPTSPSVVTSQDQLFVALDAAVTASPRASPAYVAIVTAAQDQLSVALDATGPVLPRASPAHDVIVSATFYRHPSPPITVADDTVSSRTADRS
jgi:hypothetical protein